MMKQGRSKCDRVPTCRRNRKISPFLMMLSAAGLVACAPVYQLARQNGSAGAQPQDIPRLGGALLRLVVESSPRVRILNDTLRPYGFSLDPSKDPTPGLTQVTMKALGNPCQAPAAASGTPAGCTQITAPGGTPATPQYIPVPIAAVIHTAVDECLFWTYQEDTTAVSQKKPSSRV